MDGDPCTREYCYHATPEDFPEGSLVCWITSTGQIRRIVNGANDEVDKQNGHSDKIELVVNR